MKGSLTRVWVATVHVRNMAKAVRFYRDVLGLKVQLDARRYRWIELGPDEPLAKIALREADTAEKAKRIGVETGIVFDTDDMGRLYERLSAKGVEFTRRPTKSPRGYTVADFRDPDGNEFEIIQDPTHYAQDSPPEGERALRA